MLLECLWVVRHPLDYRFQRVGPRSLVDNQHDLRSDNPIKNGLSAHTVCFVFSGIEHTNCSINVFVSKSQSTTRIATMPSSAHS